ncbi:uncharacterized protein BDZ99DRAFT_425457 [Mytilinidion resinicola]|uniref:endo-1,3(4)-beta-glucanase n=1 Tax=Mytilinidion resinicola TaxID=574789 RepID=A0A6A6Y735_9PEZI|nr:uncharacterized protein BDZ99DRAFT_425457 [Mytilinidion resinicola]KAF2804641.1 hypothetical protein BDZ99DRAFT_425457 [Mytilinidion resinicola]
MPSSSLVLSVGALTLSTLLAPVSATLYGIKDSYAGSTFFNGFTFISDPDPTHGYVKYLDQADATNAGLVKTVGAAAYMGVDFTNKYSASAVGRPSVRIESKNTYNHGLFIADIAHMPGSACGSWPAFWSLGDGTWPAHGEIDIIEGVSKNTKNLMVLHTADGCSVSSSGMTGTLNSPVCDVSVSTSGCSVTPTQANTYGTDFNTAKGGVYAMEWTSTAIKMWFFPRTAIPKSITTGNPDTTTFGTPTAAFAGSCDIDTHFKNHRFIFDTTFCGDWAGNTYGSSGCPQSSSDPITACVNYVGQNPLAFTESYWLINYFKAYTAKPAVSSTKSSTTSSKTSTKVSTSTKLSTTTKASSTVKTSSSVRTSSTSVRQVRP